MASMILVRRLAPDAPSALNFPSTPRYVSSGKEGGPLCSLTLENVCFMNCVCFFMLTYIFSLKGPDEGGVPPCHLSA